MGFILRQEGKALAALEQAEQAAAHKGGNSFEQFQEQTQEEAIQEASELGVSNDPIGSVESSSDSSSDSESDSDSSDGDNSGDEFDFDSTDDSDDGVSEEGDDDSDNEDSEEGDDASESSEENEPPAEEEEDPEETEAELKKESFRNYQVVTDPEIKFRNESLFSTFNPVTGLVGNFLTSVIAGLAVIGITFVPGLLMGMFKVVLFTFAKTFSLLNDMYEFASETYTRYTTRTSKQLEELEQLKTAVEEAKTKGLTLKQGIQKFPDVRFLQKADSLDINKNVEDYTSFMTGKILKLNAGFLEDLKRLIIISENRYLSKDYDALKEMQIKPEIFGFDQKYGELPSNGLVLYEHGIGEMIGNVELRGRFATSYYDTWDLVEKAYKNCSVFILQKPYANSTKPPIMTLDELSTFINNLELLAKASLRHQAFYEEIKNSRTGTFNKLKSLFVKLSHETVKVSFKNSVALPLHLKSAFITKIYLTAGMDIHDHTAQVIANGLGYVNEVLKLHEQKSK